MRRTLRKVVALLRRRRMERELAEEIETHRALLEEEQDPRSAGKLMGNVTLAREDSREIWSFQRWEWIAQDARHALRGLRRSPVFTAVAIVSLALGIGANTAIFSFVNAILLKRLPVPHPEQLVKFALVDHGERGGVVWRMADIDEVAKRNTTFDGIFGWFSKPISFSTQDTASDASQWVDGEMVTGQYFRTLQVQPAIGRLFDEDDVRNAIGNPVCVLSYAFWQREFAGSADIAGRSVLLNGHAYRVLGVTARGFYGAVLEQRFDVAIPATRIGDIMPAFGGDWLKGLSWMAPLARLKPGISRDQGANEIERIEPDWRKRELQLDDGGQGLNQMRTSFGKPVLALMAVVALVLLVACANLANLLLARSQARAKEFALRLSLGASRGRLIRQLLIESVMLALGGGTVGVVVAFWISQTLIGFLNTGKSAAYASHLDPDARALGFAVLLSLVTAILFGWAPAWQATRTEALSERAPFDRSVVRRSLVVFQMALSLVIVFAAGLLTRTLRTLATADLGFRPERVIAMNVDPAAAGHSANESSNIFDEMLRRARSLPGVKAAGMTATPPNGSMRLTMTVRVPGYTTKASNDPIAVFNFISPGYFAAVGQALLRGRDFNERDGKNSPWVAVVNEKFARRFFNGRDPIGAKFRQGGGDMEIVGVVADAFEGGARYGASETVYIPEKQGHTSGLTLLARTGEDPRLVIPALLGMVQRIDRRLPVYSVHTMDVDVQAGLRTERILGLLSTLFAALATLLAGIGLYGVLAYSVVRRTREVGLRLAVGAQRRDVAGLFARESMALVAAGLAIGAPAALASTRALGSLLFGVGAGDPVTLIASLATLGLAAVLATSIPLWRAAKLEPMAALRHE